MRKLFTILALMLPNLAFALDMDFYTYGGFNETLTAFQRIALIFNDGQYIVLFFIATLFGIIFGGIITFVKGVMGQEGGGAANSFSFMIYILIGVAIFKAMIIPQGNVNVFDPVLNRFQVVGGVPDIIVAFAGFTNKLERAVTESVDAGAAHPRELQGGGKGLEMFINSFYGNPLNSRAYLAKSVSQYISDCLPPAETVAGYAFDLESIKSGTVNLRNELSNIKSPSVFTIYFSAANKAGDSMSCTEAWDDNLSPQLVAGGLYDEYIADICSQSGFDVGDAAVSAAQTARCSAIIEDTGDMLFDAAAFTNTNKMMEDIMITRQIILSLSSTPASALQKLANRDITQTGLASQMVTENWLPTIRSVVFALVLGIMPVIMLFLVTPLVFKALHLGVGLFLFICIWGVTDAVVHGVATDQIVTMMQGLKTGSMGLNEVMMMPDQAMKGLAIIGKSQSMGIVLASLITAFFFKISSYAFNQMSEKYQQDIDRFGDDAANKTLTPEGRLHAANTQAEVEAMGHVSQRHGLDGYIGAQSMPSVQNLSSSIAHGNAAGSGPSIGGRMNVANRTGDIQGSETGGQTIGTEGSANAHDLKPTELSRLTGQKNSISTGGDTVAAVDLASSKQQTLQDTVGEASYVAGASRLSGDIEHGRAASEVTPGVPLVEAIQADRSKLATDNASQIEANNNSNEYVSNQTGLPVTQAATVRHENSNAPSVGKAVEFGSDVPANYQNEEYSASTDRVKSDELEKRIDPKKLGEGEAIAQATNADSKTRVEDTQGYEGIVKGEVLSQEREVKQAEAAELLQEQTNKTQDEMLSDIAVQQQADQYGDANQFKNQQELLDLNESEVAARRSGASNSNLSLDSVDLDKLKDDNVISDRNRQIAGDGALANIPLDSSGDPISVGLSNGVNASTNNDNTYTEDDTFSSKLVADGQTISELLSDPNLGNPIIDQVKSSPSAENAFTTNIAEELSRYTDANQTTSEDQHARSNLNGNLTVQNTAGARVEGGLMTPLGGASAYNDLQLIGSLGAGFELGNTGTISDSERVDAHKATATQWVEDSRAYAKDTISEYPHASILHPDVIDNMETNLMRQYIHENLEQTRETEQQRMLEIASGDQAWYADQSDTHKRNVNEYEKKDEEPNKKPSLAGETRRNARQR